MAKRKKWQDLTITDDYMFKLVMMYPHICKHLIERILHIKIRELVYLENEKSYKNHYDSKGIRLDVYVEDVENSRFIPEMQVRDYGEEELGKRTRSYQSSIDYDFLAAGHKYKELGGAAVMFFCPFKLFDGKRRVYTFKNICTEDKEITLKDDVVKVLLSSAGSPTDDIDPDVAAFLDYMNGKVTNNGFITEIDDTIRSVKLDGTKEAGYMTFQMMLDEEREEERNENILKTIKIMKKLKATKEVIIQELSENYPLPIQEITAIVEKNW